MGYGKLKLSIEKTSGSDISLDLRKPRPVLPFHGERFCIFLKFVKGVTALRPLSAALDKL